MGYDCIEPPHVYVVDDARKIWKFWLREGSAILADNSGFTKRELLKVEKVIIENHLRILTTFNEFCKGYKK